MIKPRIGNSNPHKTHNNVMMSFIRYLKVTSTPLQRHFNVIVLFGNK